MRKPNRHAGFEGCFVALFRCSVSEAGLPQSSIDLGTQKKRVYTCGSKKDFCTHVYFYGTTEQYCIKLYKTI